MRVVKHPQDAPRKAVRIVRPGYRASDVGFHHFRQAARIGYDHGSMRGHSFQSDNAERLIQAREAGYVGDLIEPKERLVGDKAGEVHVSAYAQRVCLVDKVLPIPASRNDELRIVIASSYPWQGVD